jgi:TolB protein
LDDDLWLIDRTGNNLTQLTYQPGLETFPDWSPDGRRIAFIRFEDVDDPDDLGGLYLVDTDGGNDVLLAKNTPERALSEPDWSPDGSRLAVGGYDTKRNRPGIYTVDAASGSIDLVIEGAGAAPQWSADGKSILSLRISGPRYVITLIASDGSGFVDLTDASFSSASPSWSANGNQVVFTSHIPTSPAEGVHNIWIMRADGRGMFRYTYFEEDSARYPHWAPSFPS